MSHSDISYFIMDAGTHDDYYGWIWIPDYEWAPAWVEWRYDDAYIGWAPLPPYAVFSIHIGIHYTYDYYVPYRHWHYVNYNISAILMFTIIMWHLSINTEFIIEQKCVIIMLTGMVV
jgi:hypothetical protein